jgi:hypothetical protein
MIGRRCSDFGPLRKLRRLRKNMLSSRQKQKREEMLSFRKRKRKRQRTLLPLMERTKRMVLLETKRTKLTLMGRRNINNTADITMKVSASSSIVDWTFVVESLEIV